jgi:hypothetical protein
LENWNWIKNFYLDLLKQGHSLVDIDEMDIGFYFELLTFNPEKENTENVYFIDQVLF